MLPASAPEPEAEDIFAGLGGEPEQPEVKLPAGLTEEQPSAEPVSSASTPGQPPEPEVPAVDLPPFGDQPATPQPTGPMETATAQEGRPSKRRIGRGSRIRLIILGAVIIISAAAIGATYWFVQQNQGAAQQDETSNMNQVQPVVEEPEQERPTTRDEDVMTVVDSDGDGLLDSREDELGTDPNMTDTDGDQLTDRQEVDIYKSDPLDTDTDNDGYTDGEEVRNFYNPNGPGKLIDVSDAIDEFNSQNNSEE